MVMSTLLWIILVPVFIGTFFLAWAFFPKFISRSKSYHTSEADMLLFRIVRSFVAACIVSYALGSWLGGAMGLPFNKSTSSNAAVASAEVKNSAPVVAENTSTYDSESDDRHNGQGETPTAETLEAPTYATKVEYAANLAAQPSQNYGDTSPLNSSPDYVVNPLNDTRSIHSDDNAIDPLNDTRPIH